MKHLFSIQSLTILLFSTIIFFASCGKRRELEQIGCVSGKYRYSLVEPYIYLGPMTKKRFFQYLDSPTSKHQGQLINEEMRWEKIDNPEECPITAVP
jgi:hypothetical protein